MWQLVTFLRSLSNLLKEKSQWNKLWLFGVLMRSRICSACQNNFSKVCVNSTERSSEVPSAAKETNCDIGLWPHLASDKIQKTRYKTYDAPYVGIPIFWNITWTAFHSTMSRADLSIRLQDKTEFLFLYFLTLAFSAVFVFWYRITWCEDWCLFHRLLRTNWNTDNKHSTGEKREGRGERERANLKMAHTEALRNTNPENNAERQNADGKNAEQEFPPHQKGSWTRDMETDFMERVGTRESQTEEKLGTLLLRSVSCLPKKNSIFKIHRFRWREEGA